MKTLNDYLPKGYELEDQYFYGAVVPLCLRNVWRENATEVGMTPNEFDAFLNYYDSQLPYDWDGKSFRGMKIIRQTSHQEEAEPLDLTKCWCNRYNSPIEEMEGAVVTHSLDGCTRMSKRMYEEGIAENKKANRQKKD